MEDTPRRLYWHGLLLFLLGLITGLVVPRLLNPRMGLSAHLEGIMNGTLLLALGSAWPHLRLSPRMAKIAFAAALYGTYANWLTTTAAAAFGTAALTPLAAGTHKGQQWQEALVTLGFGSVAVAMLLSSALLLWGFRRSALAREDS
jgi:hydroxylaminobenzene mutase